MSIRRARISAAALLLTCFLPIRQASAQWSAAPAVALGLAVPGGSLRDLVSEGLTAKAGVWMRAPRVPVGFTAEAMLMHAGRVRNSAATDAFRVAAVTLNATTRRHEGRLDPYGVLGAGWYWHTDPGMGLTQRSAPGVNVGIGEVIAMRDRDFFVELRLHAVRTPTADGARWTTFLPVLFGVRF